MSFTARVVGTAFGTPAQPKDVYTEDGKGGFTVERNYRTLWDSWLLTAPARGSAHPVYPAAKLETRKAQQIEPGWLCEVTLTYKRPMIEANPGSEEPDGGSPPEPGAQLPDPKYTESAATRTIPIEAHPNFASFGTVANGAIFDENNKFTGWKKTSPYAGYETYVVGSVSEIITTYSWGRPSSVSGVVGQRSADRHWLTISGSIGREGIYWAKTIIRQYSQTAWPDGIYPVPS